MIRFRPRSPVSEIKELAQWYSVSRENHRTGASRRLWRCPSFTLSFCRVGKASEDVFPFQVGEIGKDFLDAHIGAKYSSTSGAEMRIPRTHGFPPSLPGSMVMRDRQSDMV